MSIQHLTLNQFATSGLIGKKINICNEEESKYLRSDRFKALVSGDLIQAERKHENQFAFRPKTKYLFASNRLPTFEGINYGLKRRMIIVPFKRMFQVKDQNKNMLSELLSELPGIIGWAISGAKRLVDNNYQFSETESSDLCKIEFENFTSSTYMFFRENFETDDTGWISNKQMYQEYVDWCRENGKKAMSSTGFGRDLVQLGVETEIAWDHMHAERGRKVIRKREILPEEVREINKILYDKEEDKECPTLPF
jgi:putative DNA primase/helicase